MNCKVSIVVAIYNIDSLLERCILSLINQKLTDIEIILVNDASTDKSLEVCRRHASKDGRIKIVNKKVNEGLSLARNSGLEIAKGQYIIFVDGDDFINVNTCERVYQFAEETKADVVIYGAYYEQQNGGHLHMPLFSKKSVYQGDEVKNILMKEVLGALPDSKSDYDVGFSPCGRMCKLSLLKKNKIQFISERELIYEDLMFALNLYPYVNTAAVLNEPLYHYCENKASLTKRVDAERFYKVKHMYEYIMSTPRYRNLVKKDDETFLRFRRTILSYIRLCIMQLSSNKQYKSRMKEICGDEMCKEILKNYPIYKLPIKQNIFTFLLKYHFSELLYLITKIYAYH